MTNSLSLLQRELGIAPLVDTQQLRAQIALERESLAADSPSAAAPLVGRRRERAALLNRLRDGGTGRGGSLLLLGEAGIGKSRLLAFLAQAARWRGWQVFEAGGEEYARPGPYAPLDEALRQFLPRPRIQQLAQLVDHQDLAAIARLVPEVGAVVALPPLLERSASQEKLLAAAGRVVAALAEMRPQLFILDDLHWAGEEFWPLLTALTASLAGAAVLLVGAARLDELQGQPAGWAFAQQLEEAGESVLHLEGLDEADLSALVASVAGSPLPPDALSALRRASGGNPLIAHALLQEEERGAATPRHEDILTRRLARLSAPANRAIQAAAVLGSRFDYAIWTGLMADLDPASMPYVAGELEHARLLQVTDHGYRFVHDTLRHQVMTSMPQKRRRLLHGRALDALAGRSQVSAATLVHHAEEAARAVDLLTHAIQAGHDAAAVFAHQSAAAYYDLAWQRLPDADPRRFDVGCELAAVYGILARRGPQEEVLQALSDLATRGDDSRRAAAARHWSLFYNQTGRYAAAATAAAEATALARRTGDGALLAAALVSQGQALRGLGQPAQAAAHIAEAARVYEAADDRRGAAATEDLLGGLAYELGDYASAVARHGQAAAAFKGLGHRVHEALALNNLGAAYWGQGAYAAAHAAHAEALAINRAINHRRGEADNLDNMGGVDWVLGRYDQAIVHYSAALAIRRAIDDRWGVSISLGNLGSAYRLRGDLPAALDYFDQAYALNTEMGRRRGQCYNLHGRGLTLLALGRTAEARRALEAARAGRADLGEQDNLLESTAALLRCAVALGESASAAQLRAEVAAALAAGTYRASLRQKVHFACYEADRFLQRPAAAALLAAQQALRETAAPLSAEERAQFFDAVPDNRALLQAVDAYARRRSVTLPALAGDETVTVTWTVSALEDDALADRAARRRSVLARLLAESAAQGAAPQADALAQALGVSRRTVHRDLRLLAADTSAG